MILPAYRSGGLGFLWGGALCFSDLPSLHFVLPLLPNFSLAQLLLNQILYIVFPCWIHFSSKNAIRHQNQTDFQSYFPGWFF